MRASNSSSNSEKKVKTEKNNVTWNKTILKSSLHKKQLSCIIRLLAELQVYILTSINKINLNKKKYTNTVLLCYCWLHELSQPQSSVYTARIANPIIYCVVVSVSTCTTVPFRISSSYHHIRYTDDRRRRALLLLLFYLTRTLYFVLFSRCGDGQRS